MTDPVVRLYNVPDSMMLSSAETAYTEYMRYQADFGKYNSRLFTADFASGFSECISTARAIEKHSAEMGIQVKNREDYDAVRTLCVDRVDDLRYFIRHAFEGDGIYKHFGLNDFPAVSHSPDAFVMFMIGFSHSVEEYSAALTDVGCPKELITGLPDLAARLSAARVAHKDAMKAGAAHTVDRVTTYNRLWNYLVELDDAAARIYRKSSGIRQIFFLPSQPNPPSAAPVNPNPVPTPAKSSES